MAKKRKKINAYWYASVEWDKELRTSFQLPGDPFENEVARETLTNLSVFAYRDDKHGHFLLTAPTQRGNLPDEFFDSGDTSFKMEVPQKFFRFQVEMKANADGIYVPAHVPSLPELEPTRQKRIKMHGDDVLWHQFNHEVFLREINQLMARQ